MAGEGSTGQRGVVSVDYNGPCASRVPATVVQALDLKPGDTVHIHVEGERSFAIEKSPDPRARLAALRKFRGRLPPDFSFDRMELHERR